MKISMLLSIFSMFQIFGVCAQAINESPEGLYKWGLPMEVNGVEVVSTKFANGYVSLQSGEKLDGLLKLKKAEGKLTEIQLKRKKRKKFKPNQVLRYGLNILISDITDNGQKVFKDEGKNFMESRITFADRSEEVGFLAFQSNHKLLDSKPSGVKDFYVGFYFTPAMDKYLTSYPIGDIKKINHNGMDYYPINEGFVPVEKDGNSKIALFQKGTLTLKNSETLTGEIKQKKVLMKWYADSIYVKTVDGEMKVFGPGQVKSFTQTIDQQEREFINIKNVFVEKLFDGNNYLLYRNPFPSDNKLLNTIAKSATIVTAGHVADKKAENQFKRDIKDDENVLEVIESYSEANEKMVDTFYEGVEMSQDISIKKKEYIVQLKSTEEKVVLDRGKYRKWFAKQVSRCSDLGPEEHKIYSDMSKIVEAISAIDPCD